MKNYQNITAELKTHKNVHILGDFNTDLFKTNDKNTKELEEHFLTEGLYPTISIQTHKRQYSVGSCIDNIFISEIQNVTHSGTIPGIGKHHTPIFCASDLKSNCYNTKNEKQKVYYNYSNENIDKLLKCLKQKSNDELGLSSSSEEKDFTKFLTTFSDTVDDHCKLEKPKLTKRTFSNKQTSPLDNSIPCCQSLTTATSESNNLDKCAATGAKVYAEFCSTLAPSSGRPKCDINITLAPAFTAH